jgi:hypothetical protein
MALIHEYDVTLRHGVIGHLNMSKITIFWDVTLRQCTPELASYGNWKPASHSRRWPCSGMCPKWPFSGIWRSVKVLGYQRHSVIGHQRHIPGDHVLWCALDYHRLWCDAASLCDRKPAPQVRWTKTSIICYASLKIRDVLFICVITVRCPTAVACFVCLTLCTGWCFCCCVWLWLRWVKGGGGRPKVF